MRNFLFVLLMMVGGSASAQTSVYIKGTGLNYLGSRQVKLNGLSLNLPNLRGLCLTVIDASSHQHISSTNYDTYVSSAASDDLAAALNGLRRGEIGILTSHDAWENYVNSNLQEAARRLGLYKLGGGSSVGIRRPYAAIFRGSGTSAINTEPNHIAYEVMQSADAGSERAIIASWLIDDAFIGNNLSNALVSGDGGMSGSPLFVNREGNVGIGTYSPVNKLEVNGTIKTREVNVTATDWPDYVFDPSYELRPITEVKRFYEANRHLPNIPNEKEVQENGVNLSEMTIKLLEKIEELTIYLVAQNEDILALKMEVDRLNRIIETEDHD